jgi:hypothetical protein
MSVRDKLVELAYVRWELRQRADARQPARTVARAAEPGRNSAAVKRVLSIQPQPLTSS